jgi:hypothetical protein
MSEPSESVDTSWQTMASSMSRSILLPMSAAVRSSDDPDDEHRRQVMLFILRATYQAFTYAYKKGKKKKGFRNSRPSKSWG